MKKLYRVLIVYITLCVVFCSVALAQSATAGDATMTVYNDLVHLVAYTLGTLLLGLATLGVNKLRQKWGLEVPQTAMDRLTALASQGIAYAEEQARKSFKDTKLASNDKLDIAMKYVLHLAGDDKQLVKMGEEKIKKVIEAQLNLERRSLTAFAAVSTTTPATTEEKPNA